MQRKCRYEIVMCGAKKKEANIAEVPELHGCAADGATYKEAPENVEAIIGEWIEPARELARAIPEPEGRLRYVQPTAKSDLVCLDGWTSSHRPNRLSLASKPANNYHREMALCHPRLARHHRPPPHPASHQLDVCGVRRQSSASAVHPYLERPELLGMIVSRFLVAEGHTSPSCRP